MGQDAAAANAIRGDVTAVADAIVARHGPCVAAILFYGSGLRTDDPQAILDLYVLVDDLRAFHGNRAMAAAGKALPPNVLFLPANGPANAGFKVAVMTTAQFARRMRKNSLDTTLWARFCQPSVLAYARDAAAGTAVKAAIGDAGQTAVHWAIRLGPARGTVRTYWTALFRATYGAELRAEGGTRADTIFDFAPAWYEELFRAHVGADAIREETDMFRRLLKPHAAAKAAHAWSRRRRAGKILNIFRLVKAVFTFEGGVDYILWKLERHSGQHVTLTPWQKRHPLLAAPMVLPSLFKRGIIR